MSNPALLFLLQESPTMFGIRNEIIVAFVLGGFAILACISAYSAQRWAHRCYVELKQINEKLGAMNADQGLPRPDLPASYLDRNDSESSSAD
ncbi:MAG: hypothetical protein H6839_04200 [Planctomycetes bacterium]|nr:hypothetical protein [Planctomycetota bacterium]